MYRKNLDSFSIRELALKVGGTVLGDPGITVRGIASSDEAAADRISFLRTKEPKRLDKALREAKVGAVFIADVGFRDHRTDSHPVCIVVPDPMKAFVDTVELFHDRARAASGIHPSAIVDESAKIGENVAIGPYSVIGADCVIEDDVAIHSHVVVYERCAIGARTVLHAHVTIREGVEIGADCKIQSGTVLGSDGFGYFLDPACGLRPVPQVGTVALGDTVEIGANSCIDRATMGTTKIGDGTKLDNLVQIGHNVRIGRNSIICGQVGIAGSAVIGNGVTLAGQSGVADHLSVCDGVRVGGKSAVLTDIVEKGDYSGIPAIPAQEWRRAKAIERRLPEIARAVRDRRSNVNKADDVPD